MNVVDSDPYEITRFWKLDAPLIRNLLGCFKFAWEAVPAIPSLCRQLLEDAPAGEYWHSDELPGVTVGPGVLIHRSARIEPGSYIHGPTYVGPQSQVRHGAYVRGNVLLLGRNVIGHGTEVKESLFLPGSRAAHFAYVGNSILGARTNLGAGAYLSNLPLSLGGRSRPIVFQSPPDSGISVRKFGAVLGDDVQIGARVTTSPGTLLQRNVVVYPVVLVRRGVYLDGAVIR